MNVKIITQTIVIVAIIGLIVMGTGCIGSKPTGEDIKNKVIEIYGTVDTYKMNTDMDMEMEEEGMTITMNAKATGLVDNKNHKMQMDMEMTIPMIGSMNMEMYFIEDEMYTKLMGEWVRIELNETEKEDMWGKQNYIEKEIEMIKNSKVEVLGDETVRGVDSWIVKMIPDKEALEEYAISGLEQSSGAEFSKDEMPEMEFKNITIKYWIAKDNYFITKEDVWMDFTMTDSYSGESLNMKMNVSAEMYDYNKPVNIVLPEDALNAKSAEEMMAGMTEEYTEFDYELSEEDESAEGLSEEDKSAEELSEEDLEKLLEEFNKSQEDLEKLLSGLNES